MAMMTSDVRPRNLRPARFQACPPTPMTPMADDFGLSILIDDGSPMLAESGFLVYPELDRYLIRVWYRLTFLQLLRIYRRHLDGEPLELLLIAFACRSWDDFPADGSGDWGPGDMLVYQDSVLPQERAGLLIPHNRRSPTLG